MIVVTSLTKTCGACPAQWEGRTEDGRFIYVRYRWGYLRVGIGATEVEAVQDDATFGAQLGDGLDGSLSFDQLRLATHGIVEFHLDKSEEV